MKIKIEVEIDTVEDRGELEDFIEQINHLRELIAETQEESDAV